MRRLPSLFLAGLLSLSSVSAWASSENRPAAEARFKDGIQAYKEGRYPEALDSYQQAITLAPSAAGPYRELGKAFEAIGKNDAACGAYAEYLRRRPAADDASEIRDRMRRLEGGRSRGYLFLAAEAAGEVWLSGKPLGSADAPLALTPGTHQIELRSGGKATFAQVTITASESTFVELSAFQATPIAPAALAVAASGAPVKAADPADTQVNKRRRRFWIALGSAALLGTATAVTAAAISNGGGGDDDDSGRGRGRGGDDPDDDD